MHEPFMVQHYNVSAQAPDKLQVAPQLSDFQSVFKSICDIPAIQSSIVGLLSAQYQNVCDGDSMKIFTSVGELYTFMEAFDPDVYLRASPTSADIVTDMDIMRRWFADVQRLRDTLHHELLLFDFSELRSTILKQGRKTLKSFTRLAREWLYDKSVSLRVCALVLWRGRYACAPVQWLADQVKHPVSMAAVQTVPAGSGRECQ
jgi:hypothetical protein